MQKNLSKVTQDYLEWAHSEGALFKKVQYPAYFNGVCGMRALESIAPNEGLIFIPNKMLITAERALSSELSEVY